MTTAARPSKAVLAEFGVPAAHREALRNLPGGRGLTWRAGGTVLRPSAGDGETLWKANVLAQLPHTTEFRTPRPIPSASGAWTIDRWEAWHWLPGRTDETRVTDVLDAGASFHRAIAHLDRPDFLDAAEDPWARSDRIAWEEEPLPRGAALQRVADAFRPVDAESQLIHGDLLGNVMFAPRHPPVIIDWAPYWRPVGFADAIVLADAACWHALAPVEMLRLADERRDGRQLLVRALAFRMATVHLLGHWDAEMETRHAPVIDAVIG